MKTAANGNAAYTATGNSGTVPDVATIELLGNHQTAAPIDHPDGSVTTEKIADGAVTADKISAIASIDTLGCVKQYSKSVNGVATNRSGLKIENDGSIHVLCKSTGGLTIDGVGQLGVKTNGNGLTVDDNGIAINPATVSDVLAGTDNSKPVTSAALKSAAAVNNKYSTSPVQIGTWIDGTPVWRAVCTKQLSDDDIAAMVYSLPLPIYDENTAFIVNVSTARLSMSNADDEIGPCMVDDITTTYSGYDKFKISSDHSEWVSANKKTGIFATAVFEFVTTASNIVTEMTTMPDEDVPESDGEPNLDTEEVPV